MVFLEDQRKLAAPPFGKTTLLQPEMFNEFAETFTNTVMLLWTFFETAFEQRSKIGVHPART